MIVTSKKTLSVALAVLFLAFLQLNVSSQVLETTATRDFDFSAPILTVLLWAQIIVGLVGIAASISTKPPARKKGKK